MTSSSTGTGSQGDPPKPTRRRRPETRPSIPQQDRRLLFTEDFAAELHIKPSAARKRVLRGDFGPVVRIGRRLAVRVEAFERYLREQEARPGAHARRHAEGGGA